MTLTTCNTNHKVTRRRATLASRQLVLLELAEQFWSEVTNVGNGDAKAEVFHQTVNTILDKHCPYVTYKTQEDKPNFVDPTLDKLIILCDRHFKTRGWSK